MNEAAERLLRWFDVPGPAGREAMTFGRDLAISALAAERKATVKALWPFLKGHGDYCRSSFLGRDPKCTCGLSAILDTEAKR